MTLQKKLLAEDDTKIPIHGMRAVFGEVKRGKLTEAQAATILGFTAGEKTQFKTLIDSAIDIDELNDVLHLSELGLNNGTDSELKTRLGI